MRLIILFLLFFTNSFSAYLMTYSKNSLDKTFCVSSFSGSILNKEEYSIKFNWFLSDGSTYTSYLTTNGIISIKDNYSFDNNTCVSNGSSNDVKFDIFKANGIPFEINPFEPDVNGLIMGMTLQDFNFAMAIYGIALSFLISLGFILSV